MKREKELLDIRLMIRLTGPLAEALEERAKAEGRTQSAMVRRILEQELLSGSNNTKGEG